MHQHALNKSWAHRRSFSGAVFRAAEREPAMKLWQASDESSRVQFQRRYRWSLASRTEACSAGMSFIITPRRLYSRIMIVIGVCWGWTESKAEDTDSSVLPHDICFHPQNWALAIVFGEVDFMGLIWDREWTVSLLEWCLISHMLSVGG